MSSDIQEWCHYGDLADEEDGEGGGGERGGEARFNPGIMARKPGSMPLILVSGDHNANTLPNLLDDPSVFRASTLRGPRREGLVSLPARYQVKLAAHKRSLGPKCQSTTVLLQEGENHGRSGNALGDRGLSTTKSLGSLSEARNGDTTDRTKYIVNKDKLSKDDVKPPQISNKMGDRLDDLDTALKWIKQEVLQIKQEDRYLMRRLLDLRARLHSLQGLPSHFSLSSNLALLGSCGSDLDLATWTSFLSLDEDALRDPATDSPMALKEVLQSFQDRGSGSYVGPAGPGLSTLSRSVSSRETISRPHTRIKRKKSLPMANELEEDHFFDDD